jgi:prevent-host-death family protein
VKDKFSAYVEACKESPVVVTKNGKPVAMLVPIEDEDDLDSLLLAHNPRFIQILEEGYKRIQEGHGMKSEEFFAEVRRRRQAKKKAA